MSDPHLEKLGRLAFRLEGNMWNAYWAKPNTMKDSTWLGSLHMSIHNSRPDIREKFMDCMREAMGEMVFQAIGIRPMWGGPEPAPEHEKTRNSG